MADPISIMGLVITVGQILSNLYEYARHVKSATDDLRGLSQELFALKGILEYIEAQQKGTTAAVISSVKISYGSPEFTRMLESAAEFLQSLLQNLEEPKSRLKRSMQRLNWPFDKADVEKHLVRLERVKSWFIMAMITDNLVLTRELYSDVVNLSENLRDELSEMRKHRIDLANAKLLQWIAPVITSQVHSRVYQSCQQGTGLWFIRGLLHELLHDYQVGTTVLWLRGKSGSGKTVLFSHAVEATLQEFEANTDVGLAYYYCSFDDSASQKPVNILGALVAQLSTKRPSILKDLQPRFEQDQQMRRSNSLAVSDLEKAILAASNTLDLAILCIDALDESEHVNMVTESLFRILKQSTNLRVLVTSTSRPTQPTLDCAGLKVVEMEIDCVGKDIQTFINSKLEEDANLRNLNDRLKEDIREAFAKRSGGMFRWVHLSLAHLSAQRTGKAVRTALSQMPNDLNTTYTSMLCRIPESDHAIAKEALLWLSFSERPLSLSELSEAVVVDESCETLDEDSRLHAPQIILEICQGLVDYIDTTEKHVALAHFSIKTFLTSDWIQKSQAKYFSLDSTTANRIILRKCLAYLSFRDFKDGAAPSRSLLETRLKSFPLLRFAGVHWPDHAKAIELDELDKKLILSFFSTQSSLNGGNISAWIQLLVPGMHFVRVDSTQPLYYAASFGITSVVETILAVRRDVNVDARGGRRNSTPLFVACWRGHYEVVKLLLEAGANPQAVDPSTGLNALSFAKQKGLKGLYELLAESKRSRERQS